MTAITPAGASVTAWMRLPTLAVLLAACNADAPPAPPVVAPPPPVVVPPVVVARPTPPPNTAGVCRADPKVAGVADRDQPAAVAFCPAPMEMVRGNGLDIIKEPKVKPAITPDWDLDAVRDYACAYACAAAGANAYLLAWSTYEDSRPLRMHNAAVIIEHSAKAGPPRWTVVVMYRRSANLWWNINTAVHSRARPLRDFDHRPTPVDVEAAMAQGGWTFDDGPDFPLRAGNVIDETWQLALGGSPTKTFPLKASGR